MSGSGAPLVLFGLAAADLRHERLLSLCLVLALAAVLTPLLVLMGLKHGTITTLRERLIQDPVYREIRPIQARPYSDDWFDDYRWRPEVAFLLPTILPISSIVQAFSDAVSAPITLDVIPTGPGDVLLETYGVPIPNAGQIVLSDTAARMLQLAQGDSLQVRIDRNRDGRREQVTDTLAVRAILNPAATSLESLYAPIEFVIDLENYKAGMAVPARGWDGGLPQPPLHFDGIVALLPEALDELTLLRLTTSTGLTRADVLSPDGFRQLLGLDLPVGWFAYDLGTRQSPVTPASHEMLRKNHLRGHGALMLPYARIMDLQNATTGRPLPTVGLSLTPEQSRRLGWPELPWGGYAPAAAFHERARMLIPPDMDRTDRLQIRFDSAESTLTLPVEVSGNSFGSYSMAPVEWLARLNAGRHHPAVYDPQAQTVLLRQTGFYGFRLYTRSIDDVAPLARELSNAGIEVVTKAHEIERIRILDRGLTRLLWLVTIVGISGGLAVLVASLYAAVERKQRALGILRLLGLSRWTLSRFPLYQSLLLSLLALLLAMVLYRGAAALINRVFASDLALGEQICRLPTASLWLVGAGTLGLALLSASAAAWRTTRIDPAEALRED